MAWLYFIPDRPYYLSEDFSSSISGSGTLGIFFPPETRPLAR